MLSSSQPLYLAGLASFLSLLVGRAAAFLGACLRAVPMLCAWWLATPEAHAGVQGFSNPVPGFATQAAVEAAFLIAAGPVSLIDFDNYSAGSVTGTEWQGSGAIFVQPVGGGLLLQMANTQQTPYSDNSLWSAGAVAGVGSGNLRIDLAAPRSSVGLWIIDSEISSGPPNADRIDFLGVAGGVIWSILMPNSSVCGGGSSDGNFFVGYVGAQQVTSVLVAKGTAGTCPEGVGIDRAFIGVSVPAFSLTFGAGCGSPLPLQLTCAVPVLGTSWGFTTSNIDSVSPISITFFGNVRTAIPLGFLGAPGCNAYIDFLNASLTGTNVSGSSLISLSLPFNLSLMGVTLTAQSVCLTLTNQLGLLTSNGVAGTLGL